MSLTKPYYQDSAVTIYHGDCRASMANLPAESCQTCITSPPYWGLRDYGHEGQIGLETTPDKYVAKLIELFREVKRVLREDGTLWLNLGDSYNAHIGQRKTTDYAGPRQRSNAGSVGAPSRHVDGLKAKDLVGIPWMVAFALRRDGWYLRQDIIWAKPNPMPESVTDRCTKSHEYLFLLSKSPSYYYDAEAIKEPLAPSSVERLSQNVEAQEGSTRVPGKTNGNMKAVGPRFGGNKYGDQESEETRTKSWNEWKGNEQGTRNKRSVWTVATAPFKEAHFATFPPALIRPCILAGSREGDTVLDPFNGAGTTTWLAKEMGRKAIGCELNPEYIEIAARRMAQEVLL